MTVLATLLGAVLIAVALRDVFQQLFHPGTAGSLARTLMRAVWGLLRRIAAPRRRRAVLSLAGPLALLAVIAGWVVLLWVGWALIYWPRLPEQFSFSPGLDPRAQDGFVDALYLSLMTMTTLGYGSITPSPGWLRILATLQALIGFGLLTASVTWVLSLYPAFHRRQSLAQEISLVGESEHEHGDLQTSPEYLRRMGGIAMAGKYTRKRCPSDCERRRNRTGNVGAVHSFCQAYSAPVPGCL